MSDYPTWDAGKSAKVIAVGGRYSISRVYRAVYDSNREVFRTWGYQTNDGERISLGDKAAFLAATKVYDKPLDIGNNIGKRFVTETDCVNADCAEVAKGLIDCGLNPAILNLASRHHACGGYDSGAGAQEESLCRVSTLSQTLYQYFDPSLRCVRDAEVEPRGNAYPLDINFGGIYSPDVTFFRHGPTRGFEFRKEPFRCGVISVAALNFRENTYYVNEELKYKAEDGGFTPEGDTIQMNKIRTIFRVALANGHDSLVLGAFGCGAFRLPPEAVAVLFHGVLGEPEFAGCFRAVIFAILEFAAKEGAPVGENGKFAPFYEWFGKDSEICRRFSFETAECPVGLTKKGKTR